MKNVFFFLLLTAATIWACNKDTTPTSSNPGTPDNTTVTERAPFVRFVNGAGLRVCGVVPDANACTTCGNVNYGYLILSSNNQQVDLPYSEYCVTNKGTTTITVTMVVSGCVSGAINQTVLPGETYCYTISGCTITFTGSC